MGYIIVINNDELYHHGVKGQKWGIRRYQNADGTYTDAGMKRREKALNAKDAKTLYKNRKFLTDQELNAKADRIRNEQTLYEASGKKAIHDNMKKLLSTTIKVAAVAGVAYAGKKYLDNHKDEIFQKLAEGMKNATENAAKKTASAATDAAKTVAKTATTAAKETRKAAQQTDFAKRYVGTVDKLTGNVLRKAIKR